MRHSRSRSVAVTTVDTLEDSPEPGGTAHPPPSRALLVFAAVIGAAPACVQELSGGSGDAGSQPASDAGGDRAGCHEVQLLRNPAFEDDPIASGWSLESNATSDFVVTSAEGLDAPSAHTAPNKAYFGGLDGVQEHLYQDVVVPSATTRLVMTGQYQVRTSELRTGEVDRAWLELTPQGSASEELLRWSNMGATTDWTAFSQPASRSHAGETLRLGLRASNDGQRWSSFLFDTLALTASVCP